MTETFATRRQPLALLLDVEVSEPCEMNMRGYDAELSDSTYFERRIGRKEPFAGRHKLVFPLPVSPNRLRIKLTPSAGSVVVHGYTFATLERDPAGLPSADKDFVDFAQWVAVNLPQLPPTGPERFPYQSAGGKFLLDLQARILDAKGQENSTPARINRKNAVAQVSKAKMLPYTVQMRLLILLHEYMHYKLDSTDESQCDLAAVGIFISLGYASTEAMYAFVKVFDDAPDKPQLRDRVGKVIDALMGYQERNPRYVALLA